MQYKTMVLELIENRPSLHQQLASNDSLLSTMNHLAEELRTSHLDHLMLLHQTESNAPSIPLKHEAMEIAIAEIEKALDMMTPTSGELLSIDEAIAFIKHKATE